MIMTFIFTRLQSFRLAVVADTLLRGCYLSHLSRNGQVQGQQTEQLVLWSADASRDGGLGAARACWSGGKACV